MDSRIILNPPGPRGLTYWQSVECQSLRLNLLQECEYKWSGTSDSDPSAVDVLLPGATQPRHDDGRGHPQGVLEHRGQSQAAASETAGPVATVGEPSACSEEGSFVVVEAEEGLTDQDERVDVGDWDLQQDVAGERPALEHLGEGLERLGGDGH